MMALGQNESPNEGENREVTEPGKSSSGRIAHWPARAFLAIEDTFSFYLTVALVFLVMGFIAIEILSRRLANYSFIGVVDIVELAVLILTFACISGIQRDNAHIKVDLVPDMLKGKAAFILKFINLLVILAVVLVFTYISGKAALEAYQKGMLTWMIFWPTWPATMFMPIGFLLISIRVGIQLKQYLAGKGWH